MSTIVCLMGPTASGKTQLAVELVQRYPFEIISVDSAMVYREMDIGTAKPGPDILRIAPHRLINICDPCDSYSAAQFCKDALREIKDIQSHHKIPLLVGGTMMYFRALQQGIAIMPSADMDIRKKLFAEADVIGWPEMHKKLQQCDPIAARRIHPHDRQRIQRALEVFMVSGKNLTTWQNEQGDSGIKEDILNVVLMLEDRTHLHQRIAARFMQMLAHGFIDEVKHLMERGDLMMELPSMRSVGYRQVWQYLEGKSSYDEMCEQGIAATRQLAKRQLTWLRYWSNTHSFNAEAGDVVQQVCGLLDSSFMKI